MFSQEDYASEIYKYSLIIEEMKIIHAILFLVISIFLVRTTNRFRVLTDYHYKSMFYLTIGFTFLYVAPVLFLIILSYSDARTSNVDKW
jgi:hypothetical protein